MHKDLRGDERGVSVIIGAMMLILITVIAAASLALIVSEAQKQSADRQAHIDAVKNENLIITNIETTTQDDPDDPVNNPDVIKKLDITVQNMNTDSSRIFGIIVGNKYASHYRVIKENNVPPAETVDYNIVNNRYDIPASSTVVLRVYYYPDAGEPDSFTAGTKLLVTDNIQIEIMTSYINIFNRTVKHPIASVKSTVQTQDLGSGVKRNYLYLDGTDSTSDGVIKEYKWTITNPSDNGYNDEKFGKNLNYFLHTNEEYHISLTVTDNNNLIDKSYNIIIPADKNYNPPAHINLVRDSQNANIIQVSVSNAEGDPIGTDPLDHDDKVYLTTDPATMILNCGYVIEMNGAPSVPVTVLSGSGSITATCGNLQDEIIYNPLPALTANFIANPVNGANSLVVTFTDKSSGSPTAYYWNFGDTHSDTTMGTVTHTYNAEDGVVTIFQAYLTITRLSDSTSSTFGPVQIRIDNTH